MRLRFSIARMMVAVLIVAIVSATLAFAWRLRADAVLALTIALLGGSTLMVGLGKGPVRVFCLGFASFGGAYLLLAFASPHVRLSLPTTRPLVHLHDVLYGPSTIAKPDDVVPLILRLHEYLKVGHALIALATAILGGSALLLIVATIRVGRTRGPRLVMVRGVRS
jgi:hypothetical protein